MKQGSSRRPKLVLYPARNASPIPGSSPADYQIYASYYGSAGGGFFGKLKVVRQTDGRLLYPYDGSDTIGPFATTAQAVAAARARGEEIINGDLLSPEL
ncbi:hypothetical protein AWB77_04435 [Caballeronia fortuita]|uniref:Uncharacterized protein n=1 Tax=Caballeronia fortuita TaxID=1777138 RepID=A0A158CQW7_9BURK|nr:DUF6723 family protein [Caballeronia fortuita]SAK84718.1 hypothetical protein AWB77_04435 [Caballeronia fortuita]